MLTARGSSHFPRELFFLPRIFFLGFSKRKKKAQSLTTQRITLGHNGFQKDPEEYGVRQSSEDRQGLFIKGTVLLLGK
jgi:hypothetical protein